MYLTIQALVLRVCPYKDHDAILTLLTPDRGKITVKARGLRRKNSPLVAPCQLLAYGEFALFEYRGMYTINEARSIELFSPIHRDICKLSLGTYFAQVAEQISQEDLPNPEILSLLLNSLFMITKEDASLAKIKAVFELRIACLAGYTPDLTGCYVCNKEKPNKFDIFHGHLVCDRCSDGTSNGIRMPVSPGTLDAMRYICGCDEKRIFSFQVGDGAMTELSHIAESYLSAQLECGFSTLDFYKSLSIS